MGGVLGLSGWPGIATAGLSTAAFLCLQSASLPVTEAVAPVLMAGLRKRGKELEWRNYTVSYVFIWLSSVSIVYILYSEGGVILNDLLAAESGLCRALIVFATGYFAADTVDMKRGGHLTVDMQFHHGVILVAYGASIFKDKYACYLAATLIAETNTIFLHARKLMLLAGVRRETLVYRANLAALLLGFPCQRVLPHLWLLNNIYNDRGRFQAPWMFVIAFLGMLVINCLNFVLLRGIVLSDSKVIFKGLGRAMLSGSSGQRNSLMDGAPSIQSPLTQ